jgi:hypothetical protein
MRAAGRNWLGFVRYDDSRDIDASLKLLWCPSETRGNSARMQTVKLHSCCTPLQKRICLSLSLFVGASVPGPVSERLTVSSFTLRLHDMLDVCQVGNQRYKEFMHGARRPPSHHVSNQWSSRSCSSLYFVRLSP